LLVANGVAGDVDAIDNQPVDLIFLLLAPANLAAPDDRRRCHCLADLRDRYSRRCAARQLRLIYALMNENEKPRRG